jgi:hypothetical protein
MPEKYISSSENTIISQNQGKGEIVIYQSAEDGPILDVHLDNETVWLNQRQMADLFDKDTDTIGLHIRNIFKEGELEEISTTEEYSVVQNEGSRKVQRVVRFYNLDVIISVGYRVKSKRGTQFRIWATRILRDHLMKGYSINERRLTELRQTLRIVGQVIDRHDLKTHEATALMRIVSEYSKALELLDEYDHRQVKKAVGR